MIEEFIVQDSRVSAIVRRLGSVLLTVLANMTASNAGVRAALV
ncbi:hypothetical protein GCM10023147_46000 [Tsukamurella soli]|uniref:Uncharacterized protein n=1 Tax=Tsukamurella soli TaxID=644556 RepID=A0ABP8KD66_9ACTN